jgi:hypothetical protein
MFHLFHLLERAIKERKGLKKEKNKNKENFFNLKYFKRPYFFISIDQ